MSELTPLQRAKNQHKLESIDIFGRKYNSNPISFYYRRELNIQKFINDGKKIICHTPSGTIWLRLHKEFGVDREEDL